MSNLHNQFPRIKGAKYDFSSGRFVGRDGLPIHRDVFKRFGDKGIGREARAGQATLRRGILIQSLVSSQSSERPGLLEKFLNGSSELVI